VVPIHPSHPTAYTSLQLLREYSENIEGSNLKRNFLWRGSLLPLGCEATPNLATAVRLINTVYRLCDCYAVEREQAPSPQGSHQAVSSVLDACKGKYSLFKNMTMHHYRAILRAVLVANNLT